MIPFDAAVIHGRYQALRHGAQVPEVLPRGRRAPALSESCAASGRHPAGALAARGEARSRARGAAVRARSPHRLADPCGPGSSGRDGHRARADRPGARLGPARRWAAREDHQGGAAPVHQPRLSPAGAAVAEEGAARRAGGADRDAAHRGGVGGARRLGGHRLRHEPAACVGRSRHPRGGARALGGVGAGHPRVREAVRAAADAPGAGTAGALRPVDQPAHLRLLDAAAGRHRPPRAHRAPCAPASTRRAPGAAGHGLLRGRQLRHSRRPARRGGGAADRLPERSPRHRGVETRRPHRPAPPLPRPCSAPSSPDCRPSPRSAEARARPPRYARAPWKPSSNSSAKSGCAC